MRAGKHLEESGSSAHSDETYASQTDVAVKPRLRLVMAVSATYIYRTPHAREPAQLYKTLTA